MIGIWTWRCLLCSLILPLLFKEGFGIDQDEDFRIPSERIPAGSPEPIPGPTAEASLEPSLEPELPEMSLSLLVTQSYRRHVDFIRQGFPMRMVQSFYNHAIKEAAKPECLVGTEMISLGKCTTPLFDEHDEYATKSLQKLVSDEEVKAMEDKLFPDFVAKSDLPALTTTESSKIDEAETATFLRVNDGATYDWQVSVFPTDEEIRVDPGKNDSCTELADNMPYAGLTMRASSITAFVLGMAAQIVVVNGESPEARVILDKHVKLMYLAARCNRASGDTLEVPAQQLNNLIRKANLALISQSVSMTSSAFPPFEYMKTIIDGGRHFFPEEIERLSSLNSYGKINYITWTGDSISSETLDKRMASQTTLETFQDYFEDQAASSPEEEMPCSVGFSHQVRLGSIQSPNESCCAETCIISSGRRLDVFIVNEMCCLACNQGLCDLSKLARVIQVEAFRFARSEQQ